MRTTCHYFLFPDVKGFHFVFKSQNPYSIEKTEVGVTVEPEKKTLAETLQEAKKMLEKAKDKIKLIEDYYKSKKMPKELKKALDDFKKIAK